MPRSYDDWVEACVEAQSDTEIPEEFRRWAATSAVAGALGRKVWYDFGPFKVHPNMFVVLVGPPGGGKSLSLILPFDKIYSQLSTPIGTQRGSENFNNRLFAYNMEETPLHLIADRITPEKLIVDLTRSYRADLSMPQLSSGVPWGQSACTLLTSEFGAFMSRDDHLLQIALTDLWDCRSEFTYRTKTAGEYIVKAPFLNWIAGATPHQLVENLPENARSQGLLSRMIIVYNEANRRTEDIFYGSVDEYEVENLTKGLAEISRLRGQFSIDRDFREDLREEVRAGVCPRPTDPNLAEYNQRRLSHLIKLAMVRAAARRTDRKIYREDWEAAKLQLMQAEEKMPAALALFGQKQAGRVSSDLTVHLRDALIEGGKRGMPITNFKREIMRRVNTPAEIEATFKAMQEAGLIKVEGNMVCLKS